MITFIAGFCIYMYIGYMGAFGTLPLILRYPESRSTSNRSPNNRGLFQQRVLVTIHAGNNLPHSFVLSFPWVPSHQQVLHLVCRKRFFSIFGKSVSEKGTISIYEVVYIVLLMSVCVLVGLLKVEIGDIIEINGAVVGFFFIYFLPALTHIKCLYMPTIV